MKCYRLTFTFLATICLVVVGTQAMEKRVLLGNKVYLLTDQEMNWFAAADYCTAKGMHMLTIESAEEHQRFAKYLKSTVLRGNNIWTAGNELAAFKHWVWRSTGKLIEYFNWGPGEPSTHSRESCIELKSVIDYKWNNFLCNGDRLAVCEVRVTSMKDRAVIVNREIFND